MAFGENMAPTAEPAPRTDQRYRKARADHRDETAEDYTEAVADLLQRNGEARVKDLADMMGVSHVTVSRVVSRLMEKGYLITEPYRPIMLTERGKRLAEHARARHELTRDFLLALGVPAEVAEMDAEGMEHHLSEETMDAMRAFIAARR
jgi:DtxR family manganese transport transcriptional regulator